MGLFCKNNQFYLEISKKYFIFYENEILLHILIYSYYIMSEWNMFVKKIYHEGHNKNKNYSFKQALKDASKRKHEMGESTGKLANKMKTMKKTKKQGRKTRRR